MSDLFAKDEFEITFATAERHGELVCDISPEALQTVYGPLAPDGIRSHYCIFKHPSFAESSHIEMGTTRMIEGQLVQDSEKLDEKRLITLLRRWSFPEEPTPTNICKLPDEIKAVIAYLVHFALLNELPDEPTIGEYEQQDSGSENERP